MKGIALIIVSFLLVFPLTFLVGQEGFYERVEEGFEATSDRPLEVFLDVDAGEVVVERGMDALTGSVSMEYTTGEFRGDVDFDRGKNRLRVILDKKNWHKLKKSRHGDDDVWAEVRVQLPHGLDILLDSKVKAGEVTMEMGGLRLREFSLYNWAGEVEVNFEEPNPISMDFLDVDAKVGELRLIQLGNARFRKADINGGIGEIDIDFTGDLQNESRAKVDLDIGEASILLPTDVGIRMSIGGGLSFLSQKNIDRSLYRRGNSYYSEDYENAAKKFSLRITPGLGELNVDLN